MTDSAKPPVAVDKTPEEKWRWDRDGLKIQEHKHRTLLQAPKSGLQHTLDPDGERGGQNARLLSIGWGNIEPLVHPGEAQQMGLPQFVWSQNCPAQPWFPWPSHSCQQTLRGNLWHLLVRGLE